MDPWFFWLVGGFVLLLLELLFSGFVLICFAAAAFVVALLSLLPVGIDAQLAGFAAATVVSFVTVRPFFLRHMKPKDGHVETNAAALAGMNGIVTEAVNPDANSGRVRVRGEEWSAVTEDGAALPTGCKVGIMRVSGNKVVVRKLIEGD